MDEKTARWLSDLTTDFYRHVSTSFSATRQTSWPGWQRLVGETGLGPGDALSVLDLACGNARFERFLADQGLAVDAWAVDGCDELAGLARVPKRCHLSYQHLDISQTLLAGRDLSAAIAAPPCDWAVSFGFLHHVPGQELRCRVLDALVDHVRPGGVVAVSLWQFARDRRLAAKAVPVEGGDAGDYLLGWQDRSDVRRYCHSFSEDEVDELVASCRGQASQVARFSADGRTGDLNRYLLLRRHERPSLS